MFKQNASYKNDVTEVHLGPWQTSKVELFAKITVWKASKYGVISGPYFPVFGLNTRKYGPEITPYLDTFHVVNN